jgi:hypothetical protein
MPPLSPLFSPGHNNVEKESELKRLNGKIAFDLWRIDHEIKQSQLQAERQHRDTIGSVGTFAVVETKPHAQAKLHSEYNAHIQYSLSVKTPEFQRNKRNPTRNANGNERSHHVARPETREEFLKLDFASPCAVAGLQLGRTKVFLRREAFDRIKGMRPEKFHNAAAVAGFAASTSSTCERLQLSSKLACA